MKKYKIRSLSLTIILVLTIILTSCGAQFNMVGTTLGNLENGGEVAYQNNTTFYIKEGDIYRTDEVASKGKRILKGDTASLNVVGEKIYFYDREISTICKSNTEGKRIERIAELYCENFIVNRDNIYADVLTGQGGDNLNNPDNYNIVRMKTTDKKLTNKMPNTIIKKAKLLGSVGDNIYVEKKTKKGIGLFRFNLDGKVGKKLIELPADGKIVSNNKGIYVLGTKEDMYSIYQYDFDGKLKKKITNVGKNPEIHRNAINIDDEYIYYEDYTIADDKVENTIVKMNIKTGKKDILISYEQAMEYNISIASTGIMYKARPFGKIEVIPNWKSIK